MIPSAALHPLQLQFHHIPTFQRFPKITKSQGREESPSSYCFKTLWEMPSGICVHLSRDAATLKPPGLGTPLAGSFLQHCPKPRAWDGEQELELPFPAGSRCLHPAGTFPLASCSSSGSRIACCAASPHTSCTSNILKVGKRHRFRMQPELICCGLCPCLIIFPIWLPLDTGSGVDISTKVSPHLFPTMGCAAQGPELDLTSQNAPQLLGC